MPGQRTWEFGAKKCHKLNKTEKGSGQDYRMLRGGIIRDFCSNIKPQRSESESEQWESGKCPTREIFFFHSSLLQEALFSLSLLYHRAALETGRQPDLTAISTETL